MNRIPVIGGAGPLGRYVVNQLVDDYEITALERPLEGYSTFFLSAADTYSPMPTLNVVRREFDVTPTLHDDALYRNNPRASIYRIDPSVAGLDGSPGRPGPRSRAGCWACRRPIPQVRPREKEDKP